MLRGHNALRRFAPTREPDGVLIVGAQQMLTLRIRMASPKTSRSDSIALKEAFVARVGVGPAEGARGVSALGVGAGGAHIHAQEAALLFFGADGRRHYEIIRCNSLD